MLIKLIITLLTLINILNTLLILIYQINNNLINIITPLSLINQDIELIKIINTYLAFSNQALQSTIKLTIILLTLFHLYRTYLIIYPNHD